MSVFAQPDSESEELLKWGGKAIWVLQEVTIMTVSFHIRYRYTVTVQLYVCLRWDSSGMGTLLKHTYQTEKTKTKVTVKNRIRGIKGIWEKNRETKGPISTSAKT